MPRVKKTSICPLGGSGVGGKWMFWITYHLLSGPKRFGTLQHLLPGVSRRMLTRELHALEQMGIVQGQSSLHTSSKREYPLTPLGQNAEPVLHQLSTWGRWTCEQLGLEYDWSIIDEAEERYFQIEKEEKRS